MYQIGYKFKQALLIYTREDIIQREFSLINQVFGLTMVCTPRWW